MSPTIVLSLIGGYFLALILLSRITSKGADTQTFFTANRNSPWYLVAFGMIGASLSGVTFISVPGEVGNSAFTYFQMVLGYVLGYFVIIKILLPLYYRLNLISIYEYLDQRFGFWSYKTGAFFFLISRTIGAAFRLFLVAGVLQLTIFDAWKIPFEVSVLVTILLIWIYTFRGGIKTIVITDTLQTFFMLLAVVITLLAIGKEMDLGISEMTRVIADSDWSKIFIWDANNGRNFYKMFFSGALITIVMTGLDQDMMQKNLTCRSLKDAQKNMFWFSLSLIFVNMLFLGLGALLYIYAQDSGTALPANSDDVYPLLSMNYFPAVVGVFFILGITAAAYSSADSALTSLTTSFCVDFLNIDRYEEKLRRTLRLAVHIGFSVLLFFVILVFNWINDDSVINSLFTAAGYTYGPLLGMFTFGLFSKKAVKDKWAPIIALLSPLISYFLNALIPKWFDGFQLGFLVLLLNGCLTLAGLLLISRKNN
jgi:SSS family transporter